MSENVQCYTRPPPQRVFHSVLRRWMLLRRLAAKAMAMRTCCSPSYGRNAQHATARTESESWGARSSRLRPVSSAGASPSATASSAPIPLTWQERNGAWARGTVQLGGG